MFFVSQKNLIRHCRTHIGEKSVFACQVCDRKFTRKDYLVQHQAIHNDIKKF